MTAPLASPPPGVEVPGAGLPGAGLPGAELPGTDEPWQVPTEAELAGYWPDPFAGPPDDGGAWFDSLSPAELDARYAPLGEGAADPDLTGAGFAAGGPQDGLPPGPVLATLAQGIMDAGLTGLSDDELVGVLRASRRLAAWQNGVELAAVAELDARRMAQAARPRSSRASEHVSEELAVALTMTGRSADLLLGLGRDLARLPMILTALLEGRIDRARAAIFAAELAGLPDLAALAVAMAFAGIAGSMTTGQLRAALRAMVLYVDPAAARQRAERGRADARVETWQETSGNGALTGRELPAGDAIAADKRITAIARALQEAGATGTLDQLRAAVFVALLAGRDLESLVPASAPAADPAADPGPAGAGDEPGADGTPAPGSTPAGFAARPTGPTGLAALTGSVHLTMPVTAWLGLADGSGEVAGLGPLDAWTCRDLAARLTAAGAATRWHVTLTGADGCAVAHACARGSPAPPDPPGARGSPGPPGQGGGAAGRADVHRDRARHLCSRPRGVRVPAGEQGPRACPGAAADMRLPGLPPRGSGVRP